MLPYNRVAFIHECTRASHWRHISGEKNPADCASRGMRVEQLVGHDLSWRGLSCLSQAQDSWPVPVFQVENGAELEERSNSLKVSTGRVLRCWNLVDRFSSLRKLLRVTAIGLGFVSLLRRVAGSSLTAYSLNMHDLEVARIFWIKATQTVYFSDKLRIVFCQVLGNCRVAVS